MAQGPLFLQRKSYRARRMMDVIRLLPLLGLALWMIPLLWPVGDAVGDGAAQATQSIPTSVALKYLFGVWIALVAVGWLLWWRTGRGQTAPDPSNPDAPD